VLAGRLSLSKFQLSATHGSDAQGHVYKFGTFKLAAGARVYVHTGKGTNTASHRYWQRGWYVWNNTGDKATLRRADGTWIDSCSWTSGGLGYKYC